MFENETDGLWSFKRDWYDLDKLFITRNPDFRAFKIFTNIKSFPNTYFSFFSSEAFDKQLNRIRDFYLEPTEGYEREYLYLSEAKIDDFVLKTAKKFRENIFSLLNNL